MLSLWTLWTLTPDWPTGGVIPPESGTTKARPRHDQGRMRADLADGVITTPYLRTFGLRNDHLACPSPTELGPGTNLTMPSTGEFGRHDVTRTNIPENFMRRATFTAPRDTDFVDISEGGTEDGKARNFQHQQGAPVHGFIARLSSQMAAQMAAHRAQQAADTTAQCRQLD
jgi:hypothetical protein